MYEQTLENNTVIPRLKYILHAEGMIDMATATPQYQYYLKDHLGNTRVVVNSDNTAQQITNYYAFGLTSQSYQSGTSNKYLYNGKELQDDLIAGRTLDWLDYGARMYDATLGRWHTIDPLAERYFELGPYHYVRNNPINLIDPTGMSDQEPNNDCDAECQKRKKEAEEAEKKRKEWDDWYLETLLKYGDYDALDKYYQLEMSANGKGKAGLILARIINSIPPIINFGGKPMPNPIFGAAAISIDGGGNLVGAELDKGIILILRGKQIGWYTTYNEIAGGGGTGGSIGGEITRYDFSGGNDNIRLSFLEGVRTKIYVGVNVKGPFGVGTAISWSEKIEGYRVYGTSFSFGFGLSPFLLDAGMNNGKVKFTK